MIKKQKVKSERLAAYEKAAVTGVHFEMADGTVKGLKLETDIGPLEIVLESYSICLYEPAMRKVYRATVTDTRSQFPDFSKDFEDSYDRNQFVSDFDSERGRFEVAVSEFEEAAA